MKKSKEQSLFKDLKMSNFYMLRANKKFKKEEVIIDLEKSQKFSNPDYTTIDLWDSYVYDSLGRYINHSCNPSSYVDVKNKKIIAKKEITVNEEITFNYLETEREIVAPFDCNCGSKNCIGRVEKTIKSI